MKAIYLSQSRAVATPFRLRLGVIATMLVLSTTAALAQSSASASSIITYNFSLDPNSVTYASDLTVNDLGLQQYNLVNSTAGPYTAQTGSGSASESIGPNTAYNNATWSGQNSTASSASETSVGTASASVGSQENLLLTNSGSNTISLDVNALVHANASVSTTGATTATNFAQVDSYGGIFDFDTTTSTAIANPLVHLSGTAATGVTTTLTGNWTTLQISGLTYYSDSYVLNIAPGETHDLSFYSSGQGLTSAVTPEPQAFLPFIAGLVGIAGFRRRSLGRNRC